MLFFKALLAAIMIGSATGALLRTLGERPARKPPREGDPQWFPGGDGKKPEGNEKSDADDIPFDDEEMLRDILESLNNKERGENRQQRGDHERR